MSGPNSRRCSTRCVILACAGSPIGRRRARSVAPPLSMRWNSRAPATPLPGCPCPRRWRFAPRRTGTALPAPVRDLATGTGDRIAARTGLPPLSSPDLRAPQMIALHGAGMRQLMWLKTRLYDRYAIEILGPAMERAKRSCACRCNAITRPKRWIFWWMPWPNCLACRSPPDGECTEPMTDDSPLTYLGRLADPGRRGHEVLDAPGRDGGRSGPCDRRQAAARGADGPAAGRRSLDHARGTDRWEGAGADPAQKGRLGPTLSRRSRRRAGRSTPMCGWKATRCCACWRSG